MADTQTQTNRSQWWFTSPREAGERKLDPCPTFLLPLPAPHKEALQVSPRDLGEEALTRVWGAAGSRFAEAGQGDLLRLSPCSHKTPR